MRIRKSLAAQIFLIAVMAMSLCACGGGDSGSTTTVTGSVFAAPTAGAEVSAKDSLGNVIAGPVASASNGSFSIDIPTVALSSAVIVESEGGTYTDEATGASITAGLLGAYLPSGSVASGASVNLDPSSTIIYHLVTQHGKTPEEAEAVFKTAFGYTPNTAVAPENVPSTGEDKSCSLAGLRAVAFSQLTKDLGLAPDRQFDLLAAIAQDLSDGVLDGRSGAAQVAIVAGMDMAEDVQNKFENCLAGLLSNTAVNHTELTADQIGTLPFGKTALTSTYKVEYLPGMMAASEGKTTFKLRVTRLIDGSPATGLAVSLMPKMYMAAHSHSTPVDAVVEDGADPGTYKCTVYYLMASKMASGMSMGYWELNVKIGGMMGETATFYPTVGMAMGSTARATLKGVADKIPGMGGGMASARTYYLFNDGISGGMGGSSTFKLFIAARDDSMMMSYPAVSVGTTLHDQDGEAWTVDSMTVQASTDENTWLPATDNGNGHWSVSGLSGLASGGTLYVMVTVNGEQKTTDGNPASEANGYQAFTVVSGM
jgi:hypothetical protein